MLLHSKLAAVSNLRDGRSALMSIFACITSMSRLQMFMMVPAQALREAAAALRGSSAAGIRCSLGRALRRASQDHRTCGESLDASADKC